MMGLLVCVVFSCSVVSDSVQPPGLQLTRFLCPWESSGKNTGVGCHFLLHGIFLNHGSNLHLLHCRQAESLPTEALGKPSRLVIWG